MEPAGPDRKPFEVVVACELWRRSKVLFWGLFLAYLLLFMLSTPMLVGPSSTLRDLLVSPALLMSGPYVCEVWNFPPPPAVSYVVGAIAVALMGVHPLRPNDRNAVWTYVGVGLWLFCGALTAYLTLAPMMEAHFPPVDRGPP